MKVLCVCAGGRVRSVAVRKVLTDQYGIDALAVGAEKNTPETLAMLVGWSDAVLVADTPLMHHVTAINKPVIDLKLGDDVWGTESHIDLRKSVPCFNVFEEIEHCIFVMQDLLSGKLVFGSAIAKGCRGFWLEKIGLRCDEIEENIENPQK